MEHAGPQQGRSHKKEIFNTQTDAMEALIKTKLSILSTEIRDEITNIRQTLSNLEDKYSTLSTQITETKVITQHIPSLQLFQTQTTNQIMTHEIRINTLINDLNKAKIKYDKIFIDNLTVPGYIGEYSQFKTLRNYIEHNISTVTMLISNKEKNEIDLKSYKDKLESIIVQFTKGMNQFSTQQMNYCKDVRKDLIQYVDGKVKDMRELIDDVKVNNIKDVIKLRQMGESITKGVDEVTQLKQEIETLINEKVLHKEQSDMKLKVEFIDKEIFNIRNDIKKICNDIRSNKELININVKDINNIRLSTKNIIDKQSRNTNNVKVNENNSSEVIVINDSKEQIQSKNNSDSVDVSNIKVSSNRLFGNEKNNEQKVIEDNNVNDIGSIEGNSSIKGGNNITKTNSTNYTIEMNTRNRRSIVQPKGTVSPFYKQSGGVSCTVIQAKDKEDVVSKDKRRVSLHFLNDNVINKIKESKDNGKYNNNKKLYSHFRTMSENDNNKYTKTENENEIENNTLSPNVKYKLKSYIHKDISNRSCNNNNNNNNKCNNSSSNNNNVKPSSPKEHLSKSNVNPKKMISKIQKEKIDKIFENLPTAKMARNMEEICSLFNANTFSD